MEELFTNSSVIIREMCREDAESASAVHFRAFKSYLKDLMPRTEPEDAESFFKNSFTPERESQAAITFVAEEDGVILGSIKADADLRKKLGTLCDIGVQPGIGKRGIGRKLFLAAEEWWKAQGVERVWTCVSSINPGALHFYLKQGFQVDCVKKDVFFKGVDETYLIKNLNPNEVIMRKTVLKGLLGKAIQKTVNCRLKTVNYSTLEEPFRLRNERDNAWRCEFWGKIVRSAITAVYSTSDEELRAMVEQTVRSMMATQTPDGCISSYPPECQLKGWDIWGRKYVLLALMRYYTMLNQDETVLQCCCRMVDHLMSQVGEESGKTDILFTGWHDGLASSSILGAIVRLWHLTKVQKYRDFADYIIRRGCSALGNLFEDIEAGIHPSSLGNGKAYEMTSCVQGLAELAALDSGAASLELLETYYQEVRDREIFVTGTGGAKDSCGEYWYDGALRQTRPGRFGLGETCVTATWIHYCQAMLALTDDAKISNELENSLYNGILGAMAPDGTCWMHTNPTPLTGGGWKQCAPDQILSCFKTPFDGHDCCRAQGPEGLMSAALIAVTEKQEALTVNLFEPLVSGNLEITGNYPVEPESILRFTKETKTTLRLRTPEFLKSIKLNGKEIPFSCGKYAEISRTWTPADEVRMEFDFSLKEITPPDNSKFIAVKRGPVLLAEDSRNIVPEAPVQIQWRGKNLCDYATAGNQMCESNTLTVWFPDSKESPKY